HWKLPAANLATKAPVPQRSAPATWSLRLQAEQCAVRSPENRSYFAAGQCNTAPIRRLPRPDLRHCRNARRPEYRHSLEFSSGGSSPWTELALTRNSTTTYCP